MFNSKYGDVLSKVQKTQIRVYTNTSMIYEGLKTKAYIKHLQKTSSVQFNIWQRILKVQNKFYRNTSTHGKVSKTKEYIKAPTKVKISSVQFKT